MVNEKDIFYGFKEIKNCLGFQKMKNNVMISFE